MRSTLPIAQVRKFKPELVATVDRMLDRHCDREIADILNRDGWRSSEERLRAAFDYRTNRL
jgi:hypothetical protein